MYEYSNLPHIHHKLSTTTKSKEFDNNHLEMATSSSLSTSAVQTSAIVDKIASVSLSASDKTEIKESTKAEIEMTKEEADDKDKEELGIFEHRYEFCGKKVFIEEDFDAGLGGTMFDGAACIANYIEALYNIDNNVFNGKRVVELGAGCGLPGLLCGKLNARVVLTDIEETVVLIDENIAHNQSEDNVKSFILDWGNEKDLNGFVKEYLDNESGFFKSISSDQSKKPSVDFIIAADTIYSPKAVPLFINVLKVLSNKDTRTIFAHPKSRSQESSKLFWDMIKIDFEVEKIPSTMFAQGKGFKAPTEGVFVFKLR